MSPMAVFIFFLLYIFYSSKTFEVKREEFCYSYSVLEKIITYFLASFRNLEALLTSWLQTALHYDPEKRGNRRRPGEDAVCLSNMDHILSTKVDNL